ncbi:MAG: 23S rRNA (uracil(1939)-C(5))-methyltransferase RlmD [Rhabdochlamydiaceae bacterium]
MGRSKFKPFDTRLTIEKFSQDYRGIAFQVGNQGQNHKIEVIGALPGEELEAHVYAKKRRLYKARLKNISKPSPLRITPPCPYVPICGGCSFQHLNYQSQLEEKQKHLESLFADTLIQQDLHLSPIIGCKTPWKYRNKMEYTFSQNREGEQFLGLILADSKGKVLNLNSCSIAPDWFCNVLNGVRLWWRHSSLKAYHRLKNEGSLRTLTLREGRNTQHKMVILTVSGRAEYAIPKEDLDSFVSSICQSLTDVSQLSIFLRIQQIQKGEPTQYYELPLLGSEYLEEKLHIHLLDRSLELNFKISPSSFFQPHTTQAQVLYQTALEKLDLKATMEVCDFYCGTGTIGLIMSQFVKNVRGIELNPYAVFDARLNQELNNIKNVQFEIGDVGLVLQKWREKDPSYHPDVVVVDPARQGLDEKAITHILALKPQKILYISCNPASQKRDIDIILNHNYALVHLQGVDQFAHTVHLETIAVLEFKQG